jgi:hypothetical protein
MLIQGGIPDAWDSQRQATANGQRRAWYLQLDIRNYFMRIDKAILWRLLEPHIADEDARWLTELLVFHDCTEGHILKCTPEEIARVPAQKTLLRCEPGKGLPIGNLNSQFFANVYLNGLDQFVKHRLRCRHYIRYCDDFVLLSPDRDELLSWRGLIEGYLRDALALELNPRERLRPVSDGVDGSARGDGDSAGQCPQRRALQPQRRTSATPESGQEPTLTVRAARGSIRPIAVTVAVSMTVCPATQSRPPSTLCGIDVYSCHAKPSWKHPPLRAFGPTTGRRTSGENSAPGLRAARLQAMSFRGPVACARSAGPATVAENRAAFGSFITTGWQTGASGSS